MLALLSPAKRLDFDTPCPPLPETTSPRHLNQALKLAEHLRAFDAQALGQLMGISNKLAKLNVERFAQFSQINHQSDAARPAILAFQGDVYRGLRASDFDNEALSWSQSHLGILSGLYGLLRPLDAILPYRLEMGTRWGIDHHPTLYSFWRDLLCRDLQMRQPEMVINLASQEYSQVIDFEALPWPTLHIHFQTIKNGLPKTIGLHAKHARGLMARYIVDQRLTTPEALKDFQEGGYCLDSARSDNHRLVFVRPA